MHYYERKKEIFQFLLQKDCCLRCCLRFVAVNATLQVTLPELFRDPELTSKQLGYLTDDVKVDFSKTCVTCLGILQDDVIESAIQKVVDTCQSVYKDINLFTCALTIPISILLKERAMQIRVINEFQIMEEDLQTYRKSLQSAKDVWRWCAYPKLQQILGVKPGYAACNGFNSCTGCVKCIPSLTIDVFFSHKDDECELKSLMANFGNANKTSRKSQEVYSRKGIENVLSEISNEKFEACCSVNLKVPETRVQVDRVQCTHDSIFIGGRYTKLSRKLSQTPWSINGEKKMESSVQEVIFDIIVKYIEMDGAKFLSSGREDVDVRMLYNGRPFAVELLNPKTPNITRDMLSNIVADINQSETVNVVSDMRILTREDLKRLKEGEIEKTKDYRAVCIYKSKGDLTLLEKLNNIGKIEVVQKTPIRVLHRRPLAPRMRTIHAIRARPMRDFGDDIPKNCGDLCDDIDDLFVLDLRTQAGTYVKEFVHGDFGRTKPNLCDLLQAEVDIIALDVTGINIVWP